MPTTLVASQLRGMLSNLFLTRTYSFYPPTLPDTGCGPCVAKNLTVFAACLAHFYLEHAAFVHLSFAPVNRTCSVLLPMPVGTRA